MNTIIDLSASVQYGAFFYMLKKPSVFQVSSTELMFLVNSLEPSNEDCKLLTTAIVVVYRLLSVMRLSSFRLHWGSCLVARQFTFCKHFTTRNFYDTWSGNES